MPVPNFFGIGIDFLVNILIPAFMFVVLLSVVWLFLKVVWVGLKFLAPSVTATVKDNWVLILGLLPHIEWPRKKDK